MQHFANAGKYRQSACHASTSEQVIKHLCLSRSSCNIRFESSFTILNTHSLWRNNTVVIHALIYKCCDCRAVPETFGAYDPCPDVPTKSRVCFRLARDAPSNCTPSHAQDLLLCRRGRLLNTSICGNLTRVVTLPGVGSGVCVRPARRDPVYD